MEYIIVDSETKNRKRLHLLCEEHCPDLSMVGNAGSVAEAIPLIDEANPKLVFLDIRLPQQSGFSLLQHYGSNLPFSVVFTTQNDNYAFQAFQYRAVDYLQKPIESQQLISAVRKVRKVWSNIDPDERLDNLRMALTSDKINKIALTTLDGYNFVKYENIVRCEAQGNYTYVYLTDSASLLITKTLKHYEELLLPKDFFRIHKSHLINLRCVRKFIKGKKCFVEMIDGAQIEVSFRKREALLGRLAEIG